MNEDQAEGVLQRRHCNHVAATKKPTRMQLSWLNHIATGKVARIGHTYACRMQIDNTRTRAQYLTTLNLWANGWINVKHIENDRYRVHLTEAGKQVLKENTK